MIDVGCLELHGVIKFGLDIRCILCVYVVGNQELAYGVQGHNGAAGFVAASCASRCGG